jgi:pyruvate dehydrogenase E1 component alpha subunit
MIFSLMLRDMKLIRAFEIALAARADCGFQLLSAGEEAVAVGICSALAPEDQLLTGGRSIGFALARGLDPKRVMAELLGKSTGPNKGKAGRGHLSWPEAGFFGAHAVVGGNISIAAGVALARQMAGEPGIAVVVFGDGAAGAGVLHETLNFSLLWRLPILFVCNNNQFSVSTPRSAALAPKFLSDLALAYGMTASTIDGMDVLGVADAAAAAAARIQQGNGPEFLECVSFRFGPHSTSARETRTADELKEIMARCPIAALSSRVALAAIARMDEEIAETIAAALAFADASPYPDAVEALTDVW